MIDTSTSTSNYPFLDASSTPTITELTTSSSTNVLSNANDNEKLVSVTYNVNDVTTVLNSLGDYTNGGIPTSVFLIVAPTVSSSTVNC